LCGMWLWWSRVQFLALERGERKYWMKLHDLRLTRNVQVKELLGGKACGRRVHEVGKAGSYALKGTRAKVFFLPLHPGP